MNDSTPLRRSEADRWRIVLDQARAEVASGSVHDLDDVLAKLRADLAHIEAGKGQTG